MGLTFSCQHCGKRYSVAEAHAGRRFPCKGCGAGIQVPKPSLPSSLDLFDLEDAVDEAEPMPPAFGNRSRSRADGVGVPVWGWVIGGVLALGVIVLGIVATSSPQVAEPQVGVVEVPKESVQAAPAPQERAPAKVAEVTQADSRFIRDQPTSAKTPGWVVKVDPPVDQPVFPPVKPWTIPVPDAYSPNDILFPSTPSAFVMIGGNDAEKHFREVWDLRQPERIGRLAGRLEAADPMALSPDGAYFVAHTNPLPRTTDIWRVADAQRIGRIKDDENIPDVIDFAGADRLLIGTSYAKTLQVWNITEGKPSVRLQTPVRFDTDSLAFSPNRRYLALMLASDERLQIYDLTNGAMAGEARVPKEGNLSLDCQGMAFSPDGTALTGLFGGGFEAAHILTFDVATGKLESDHRRAGYLPFGQSFGHKGRIVQWLPDGSGWLLHDQTVVERTSGQITWTLPFDDRRGDVKAPRRIIDADRVVTVVKVRNQKTLKLDTLPKDKMQTAMSLAKSGGNALDAALPPLKAVDLAAAKRITGSTGSGWSPVIDPLVIGKKALVRSIALRVKSEEILGVRVSTSESAHAVVASSPGGFRPSVDQGRIGQSPRRLDRYDLGSGRALGGFEFPSVSELVAVSPKGTHILMTDAAGHDRLDLYAADGTHLVGTRPYDREPSEAGAVVWSSFLTDTKLLTVNSKGMLILWSIPDFKAIYIASAACEGVPVLSPGRKSLAVLKGGTLRLLDPATAATQATGAKVAAPGTSGLSAGAFRPDGKELAAVVNGSLVRWDLTTGKILDETPVPDPKATRLQYADARFLLLDDKMLLDLNLKRVVWHYRGGRHTSDSPDGSHWYAGGPFLATGSLKALELPPKEATRFLAAEADPKTKVLLGKGATLAIEVEGAPPREPDSFRKRMIDGLAAKLTETGARYATGSPVRLVLKFQEKDTGGTIELQKFGTGVATEKRSIPARNLLCELSVHDGGLPILLSQQTFGPQMFGIQRLPAGESDWEGYLKSTHWLAAGDRFISTPLPYFVGRGSASPAILPGSTDLGYAVP